MREGVLIACHGLTVVDEREDLVCEILREAVEFGVGHECKVVLLGKGGSTE